MQVSFLWPNSLYKTFNSLKIDEIIYRCTIHSSMLFPIKILMFLIQMCHFLNNWAFHAACKQCFDFSSLWFKLQLLSDISLATSFELSELVQLWPILNSNRPWKRYRCQLMLDSIKNCSPCAKSSLTHLKSPWC